jgi:hypothetical protein
LLFLKNGQLLLDNPLPEAFTRLEELGLGQFASKGSEQYEEGFH